MASEVVRSYKGLPAHLTFVRLLPCVDFHVLPPPAALHEPPAAVLADKRSVPRVGTHVILQALRRAHLLATLWTLHTNVQTDRRILRFCVTRFMTQMRPLTPGSFEALPTVGAAEMPSSGDYRHVVPALTVILQVLQVLEAACTGRTGVEPAGRGRRVGLTHVDPKVDFRVKGAAADSAGVFLDEV